MKKIILIAILAIAGFANAQKGTYLVMGTVGFATSKTDDGVNENKSSTFTFAPKVGYQFTDHWTLGLVASYSRNKNEVNNVALNESTSTGYSFGVFGRYTQPLTDIFSVYGDLSTSFNNAKTEYNPGTAEYKSNGFGIAFTPAVYVNLKNNFGFNFGFGGINYGHSSVDGGGDSSGFNLDFGNSFTMGV